MTILVTGSEGFIGRHLTALLESQGHRVRRFSRSLGHDLLREEDLRAVAATEVEAVVHLAGRSFVPDSWKDPEGFERVNLGGTRNVIRFCLERQARLLFVSSYVYGIPRFLPIDESHPVEAFNPYARSKLLAENEILSTAGLASTIVRPFNIYGPGQDPRFLIAQLIRDFRESGEVVVQNLRPKRDYLFVSDFADALGVLLERPALGEIHNIGAGQSWSVEDIIVALEAVIGRPIPHRSRDLMRENEVMDVVASCRLRREGLWAPRIELSEGLRRCWEAAERPTDMDAPPFASRS